MERGYTPLLGALPPQQYDFANWDFFQSEALRFHNLTWPDRQLVLDRIATFRSLMSPKVIAQLGSLVNLHPRFRTTEGWDDWLLAVTDALRSHDDTIKDPITAQSWVEQFKSGKIAARHLWSGLDLLASKGEIASDEQRQLFWEAHSWEKQALLVERCPYFDPKDSIWRDDDDDADDDADSSTSRHMAEQLLCRIMALSKEDDDITLNRCIIFSVGALLLVLLIVGIGLLIAFATTISRQGGNPLYIIFGIYALVGALALLIPLIIKCFRLRELKRNQRESRLHERV